MTLLLLNATSFHKSTRPGDPTRQCVCPSAHLAGLVFVTLLLLNAGRGSQTKLAAFIAEMAGEEVDTGTTAVRKTGVAKGD